MDGKKIAKITPRLTGVKDAQNWLSMQPSPLRYIDGDGARFGELNEDNELHGRGIYISNYGSIVIGYWENDDSSTGNYINIYSNGEFKVGERYFKDGRICDRGTRYFRDGSEYKYDREW